MDLRKGKCIALGHGTGIEPATAILKEGLILHKIKLDENFEFLGGEISNHTLQIAYDIMANKRKFETWGHHDTKAVVVLRLPNGYFDFCDQRFPFPYSDAVELDGDDFTLRIRPEFICGYYDVAGHKFVDNPQYYDNLSEEEKLKCDAKLKECYEMAKERPGYTTHEMLPVSLEKDRTEYIPFNEDTERRVDPPSLGWR